MYEKQAKCKEINQMNQNFTKGKKTIKFSGTKVPQEQLEDLTDRLKSLEKICLYKKLTFKLKLTSRHCVLILTAIAYLNTSAYQIRV